MSDITGSFDKGLKQVCKMFKVKGRVIPVTEGDMRIIVELNNGIALEGESKLDDDEQVRHDGSGDDDHGDVALVKLLADGGAKTVGDGARGVGESD